MTTRFAPGFRLSSLDIVVLVVGVVGATAMAAIVPWVAFVIAFVVGHFFLFCNVVRMARPLELIWAAIFTTCAAATILTGQPGWLSTGAISLLATAVVVALELRKPSYHGLAWQRINPDLPDWWAATHEASSDGLPPAA